MTINSKILLCLILLIAVHSLSESQSQEQPQIVTVEYCDLIENQAKYAGQIIRLQTVMLAFWHNSSLYDDKCKEVTLEAVFDCNNDEECSVLRKPVHRDMDYNGDVGRVEAVFIGRLVLPEKTADSKSRARFMIKKIEQTNRIPRDTPWPVGN